MVIGSSESSTYQFQFPIVTDIFDLLVIVAIREQQAKPAWGAPRAAFGGHDRESGAQLHCGCFFSHA